MYNLKGGSSAWLVSGKKMEVSEPVNQMPVNDFEEKVRGAQVALVDIGAEWCPPCKKMKPIVETLEKEKYTVVKIDGGAQTELGKQLNVSAFPTFIVYKNGFEVTRKTGVLDITELRNLLK